MHKDVLPHWKRGPPSGGGGGYNEGKEKVRHTITCPERSCHRSVTMFKLQKNQKEREAKLTPVPGEKTATTYPINKAGGSGKRGLEKKNGWQLTPENGPKSGGRQSRLCLYRQVKVLAITPGSAGPHPRVGCGGMKKKRESWGRGDNAQKKASSSLNTH